MACHPITASFAIVAQRPIAQDEEVTFDYLDLAHDGAIHDRATPDRSADERRALLREHFGFECACTLCLRAGS